jgi:hypothetical protein
MYQNNQVIYPDDLIIEFTRVTLIVSDHNISYCGTGCNEGVNPVTTDATTPGSSWSFDVDLGPDLEYITSGTQSNARWKVKGGWSIFFGPPPARRTLSRMQNYLIRTESIGGVVTPTVCNKTTDKPWTVDQRIKVPYTAEYMMYSCVDDSNDDEDSHSKAPFIYASTAGSAILVVVIMMAQFL